MKRLRTCRPFAAIWAAVLLLTVLLSGCGSITESQKTSMDNSRSSSGGKLQVVATIFPPYDFASQIAGDRADVHMLLKPGEEVHSYEPTPQDIRMIQNSDLFIYVGGENDVWVDNIMDSLSEKGPAAVRLIDLVDTFEEEHLEGMMPEKGEHDHGHSEEEVGHGDTEAGAGHDQTHEEAEEDHDRENHPEEDAGHEVHGHVHEEEPDEHVWTSPENCVILIENLTDAFCELDPDGADQYRRNVDAYRTAFAELDAQYREMADSAVRKTVLFGDRFPFRYLAEELGLTCYAAFAGCSSESEPSAATIAFLINKAAEERLPVIFKIEFSNGNIASAVSEAAEQRIRKQNGGISTEQIRVLQLHSCQNVTRDEFISGETCLSLMTQNLEVLRQALN